MIVAHVPVRSAVMGSAKVASSASMMSATPTRLVRPARAAPLTVMTRLRAPTVTQITLSSTVVTASVPSPSRAAAAVSPIAAPARARPAVTGPATQTRTASLAPRIAIIVARTPATRRPVQPAVMAPVVGVRAAAAVTPIVVHALWAASTWSAPDLRIASTVRVTAVHPYIQGPSTSGMHATRTPFAATGPAPVESNVPIAQVIAVCVR